MPPELEFTKEFIEAWIEKDRKTGCWIWTRYYGRKQPRRVKRGPHRVTYNLFTGKWLESTMYLVQACGDKRCVNPDHMEERFSQGSPGSERDCDSWGVGSDYRFKNGMQNPKTKIDPKEVQTIKALLLLEVPTSQVAEFFGINRSTVHRIRHGKTWTHIPWPRKDRAARLVEVWAKTQRLGIVIRGMEDALKELDRSK